MKNILLITLLMVLTSVVSHAKKGEQLVYSNFTLKDRIDTIQSENGTSTIQKSIIVEVSGEAQKIVSEKNEVIDVLIANKSKFFPTDWKFLKKNIYKLGKSHYLVDYIKGDTKGNSEGYILILDINYKEVYMALSKSFGKGLSIESHIKNIGKDENGFHIEVEYVSEGVKRSEVISIK